jgi:hypothetical protein
MGKLSFLITLTLLSFNSFAFVSLNDFNNQINGAPTLELDTDLNQVKIGDNFIQLDPNQFQTVIGNNNAIATISKLDPVLLENLTASSRASLQNKITLGKIIRPKFCAKCPGKFMYRLPINETYKVTDYIEYLISLSDEDLYDALDRGVAGQCRYIIREYLPPAAKINFACSHALYIPKPIPVTRASAFPQKIKCIPGSISALGKVIGCLSNYNAQVCKKPTLKQRTVAMLRNRLNQTLKNPSNDVCNIASVVARLNTSQMEVFDAKDMANSSKVTFRKVNGQVKCFAKISPDNTYLYGDQQIVTLDGTPTIELHSKPCQVAYYRNKRVGTTKGKGPSKKTPGTFTIPKASDSESSDITASLSKIPLHDLMLKKHEKYVIDIPEINLATEAELNRIGQIDIAKLTGDMLGKLDIQFNPELQQSVVINPISTFSLMQTTLSTFSTSLGTLGTTTFGTTSTINNVNTTIDSNTLNNTQNVAPSTMQNLPSTMNIIQR